MPITFHETSPDPGLDTEASKSLLYQLLEAYLRLNQSPSDEQIHSLASALGLDPETLETHIYELFAEVLEDADSDFGEDAEFDDVSPPDNDESFGELLEFPTQASSPDNRAAEFDGRPDLEQAGQPDPLKEGASIDGAPDEELLETL